MGILYSGGQSDGFKIEISVEGAHNLFVRRIKISVCNILLLLFSKHYID